MDVLYQIALIILVSILLSICGWKARMLTPKGSVAAFITGSIVGIFGNLDWFIILTTFTILGFIATRFRIGSKIKDGLQEGKYGERTHMNVLGVGLPPCIVSIAYWLIGGDYQLLMNIAFVGTIAVAATDTIASEIGVKDKTVWMITTFKRVEAGTNGGISVLGTVSSTIASFLICTFSWMVIYHTMDAYMLIPFVAGVLGNLLDSVLGATIENSGYISKYTNNFVTAVIGALTGVAFYIIIA